MHATFYKTPLDANIKNQLENNNLAMYINVLSSLFLKFYIKKYKKKSDIFRNRLILSKNMYEDETTFT